MTKSGESKSCPLCKQPLESQLRRQRVSKGRNHDFFSFSLRRSSLLSALVLMLATVTLTWFSVSPILGLVLAMAVSSLGAAYCVKQAQRTLFGRKAIRRPVSKQILLASLQLTFGAGAAMYLTQANYVMSAALLFLILLVVLPLSIPRSLDCLPGSPSLIQALGYMNKHYFVLLVGALMLGLMSWVAIDLISAELPDYLSASLSALLVMLAQYAWFYMLSTVCQTMHEDDRALIPMQSSKVRPRDAEIDIALKEGHYALVNDLLVKDLNQNPMQYRLEHMMSLAKARADIDAQHTYSLSLIEYRLQRGQIGETLALLGWLRTKLDGFRIRDARLSLKLAKLAYERKSYSDVLWLAKDAHLRFGRASLQTAELYLLVARVMKEHFHDVAKAQGFMRFADEAARLRKEQSIQESDAQRIRH